MAHLFCSFLKAPHSSGSTLFSGAMPLNSQLSTLNLFVSLVASGGSEATVRVQFYMKSLVSVMAVIGLGLSQLNAQAPADGKPPAGSRPPAAAPAADGSVTRLPAAETARVPKPGTGY